MRAQALLFVALLLIYNLNLRQVSSHDTYASRFVPISVLRDGDLILDEFVPAEMKQRANRNLLSDNFVYVRGHFYDSHPPIGPLLTMPVYPLPVWIGIPRDPELVGNLFSKLAASMMAALSAVMIFLGSKRLLVVLHGAVDSDRSHSDLARIALLAAIAYGLATSVWSTASLAIWTHTPAVLGFAVALWALTAGHPGLAGAALAAACFARPATAPVAALLGLYLIHRAWRHGWTSTAADSNRRDLWRFCAGVVVTGSMGVVYNYWLFGNLVGGAPFRTEVWFRELGTRSMFAGSLPAGLAGLTVSPSRGILIFSPVVLVAAYGAIRAWRSPLPPGSTPGRWPRRSGAPFDRADAILLMRYASLAAVAILLTYSKFIAWWGGHGYGPRYLTDAMPFVGFLFAPGLLPLFKGTIRARIGKIAAITVLVYSISIQLVGAFCWPSPWTLNNDPPYRFRLWDWRDSEIEVCIRSGPRVDPAARRLFAFMRGRRT